MALVLIIIEKFMPWAYVSPAPKPEPEPAENLRGLTTLTATRYHGLSASAESGSRSHSAGLALQAGARPNVTH
jgi:hypothetical protein